MKRNHHTSFEASYIRNFVFGVEDSIVSTVGLLSGIAIAGVPRATIFLTGIVLIFVEAISMAAGSFLSEKSAEDFEQHAKASVTAARTDSAIMFFSYLISGLLPLAPYMFFDIAEAFWVSIIISIGSLFLLGAVSAKLAHVSIMRSALRMMSIGGIAIAVGIMVGKFTGA